jgi:phosphoribosylformimino-5-aminoimidazole carboxamide ribotide isomerase
MDTFEIYPAIDLRGGRVVRLKQGDPNRLTLYDDDPVATGDRWTSLGARWLHVVNLDGAFDEAGADNWACLPQLVNLGAKLQFGGGLRTAGDLQRAFDFGVSRVILGTVAIENPQLVSDAIERFGTDHVAVGLDARDGLIRTHGWQKDGATTALELARHMVDLGLRTVIHTDITRDGILTGANVPASAKLSRATSLEVIVAGGVASIADVHLARERASEGITGLIIGRALYEGAVDLAEALAISIKSEG